MLTKGSMDLTDLLRSQVVLGVSAFDYFIHELCRTGMLEAAKGSRLKTDAFKRFQVAMISVEQLILGAPEEVWLGNAVRDKHSWLSFQDPDKVADAIRLISPIELWKDVATSLNSKPEDIKRTLKLIVERRNKIAHESDMDPTLTGNRWPITEQLANNAVDDLEIIGSTIYNLVK